MGWNQLGIFFTCIGLDPHSLNFVDPVQHTINADSHRCQFCFLLMLGILEINTMAIFKFLNGRIELITNFWKYAILSPLSVLSLFLYHITSFLTCFPLGLLWYQKCFSTKCFQKQWCDWRLWTINKFHELGTSPRYLLHFNYFDHRNELCSAKYID